MYSIFLPELSLYQLPREWYRPAVLLLLVIKIGLGNGVEVSNELTVFI
jgi:hypothetical protein